MDSKHTQYTKVQTQKYSTHSWSQPHIIVATRNLLVMNANRTQYSLVIILEQKFPIDPSKAQANSHPQQHD